MKKRVKREVRTLGSIVPHFAPFNRWEREECVSFRGIYSYAGFALFFEGFEEGFMITSEKLPDLCYKFVWKFHVRGWENKKAVGT